VVAWPRNRRVERDGTRRLAPPEDGGALPGVRARRPLDGGGGVYHNGATMSPLTIDIVSDVICPWCLIGTRRLDETLATLPDLPIAVRYHPFLLDPATPPEGVDLRERLRKKYGGDPEAMFARVEAAARDAGIPLDFARVRRTVPTLPAHTLLRHAAPLGTQQALARALFDAYFLEGRDVGKPDVLAELATRHGFEADAVRTLLADPAELEQTRADAAAMVEQGITGVPFFIFGERVAVSGAQPPDVLRAAIARARG
jgi:predicted DsbA family dithiol-disulfide isomerase